jgi:hypothetical protein
MTLRAIVLAVAALAIQAPAAFAGTASIAGTTLTFTAAPGEANALRLSYSNTDRAYSVGDSAPVTAGRGCTAISGGRVSCPGAAVTAVTAGLGDGDDDGDAGVDCQGGEGDVVKPSEKPKLESCPAAVSLKVSVNRVSAKQFVAGKLKITIRCSIHCATRFKLIAPRQVKRYVHHGGNSIEARPISLDLAGFLKLAPTTQRTNAFVNGLSTQKALSRLHAFKLSLMVQAYTGQNRETTRTIPVQIG